MLGLVLFALITDAWGNAVIFGVDNSLSSHSNNRMNMFWVLGERPIDDINGSVAAADKKFSVSFSKSKTKFC